MLFEIVLYVEHRKAGRVTVGDPRITAVEVNGVKRDPKSTSFNEAVKHIMNETDLEPWGQPQQIGPKSHFTTYKHTYRKPGVYVQSRYGRWAVAHEKDGAWFTKKAGEDVEVRFRTKSEAMTQVDYWAGIDHAAELHQKTVDKDFQTRRGTYLKAEAERAEKRSLMSPDELAETAAKDIEELGFE